MSRVVAVAEPAVSRPLRPQEERWIREAARTRVAEEQENFEAAVSSMRNRIRAGEPLQYVLGSWQFRGLSLRVCPGVLIPRFETELIVDLVVRACGGRRKPRIVDLGTGSGAIALAVAKEIPEAHVVATDISDEALQVGAGNAVRNGLVEQVVWRSGNWYDALGEDASFDVVVSNPPYISEREWGQLDPVVKDWEPVQALLAGLDGLRDLREVARGARGVLNEGGTLVVEIGATQGQRVAELFVEAGLVDVEVLQDLCSRDRFVLGRADACL